MLSSLTFSEPFADDSQFVQQAITKYLRHNHLPHILLLRTATARAVEDFGAGSGIKTRRGVD